MSPEKRWNGLGPEAPKGNGKVEWEGAKDMDGRLLGAIRLLLEVTEAQITAEAQAGGRSEVAASGEAARSSGEDEVRSGVVSGGGPLPSSEGERLARGGTASVSADAADNPQFNMRRFRALQEGLRVEERVVSRQAEAQAGDVAELRRAQADGARDDGDGEAEKAARARREAAFWQTEALRQAEVSQDVLRAIEARAARGRMETETETARRGEARWGVDPALVADRLDPGAGATRGDRSRETPRSEDAIHRSSGAGDDGVVARMTLQDVSDYFQRDARRYGV